MPAPSARPSKLVVVKSEFACNTKSVEGTSQERMKLVLEGAIVNVAVGVDCLVQMPPLAAATNLFPSAAEATDVQFVPGAPVSVQLAPEFVEV